MLLFLKTPAFGFFCLVFCVFEQFGRITKSALSYSENVSSVTPNFETLNKNFDVEK